VSLLNLFGDDADFFTGKTPESRARGVGQIAWESIPLISEAVTFRDIKNELSKKNPNWGVIAMLGGAGLLGLVPLIGDALGTTVKKSIKKANKVELTEKQKNAQEIIDLLKSGDAKKVTNEMLKNADQRYLFENYDLPMDTQSRMERAKEMGFDEDAFHGTDYDFKSFSNFPTFMSDQPAVADTYTNFSDIDSGATGLILPLRVPEANKDLPYLEVFGKGENWSNLDKNLEVYDPSLGETDLDTVVSMRNPQMSEGFLGATDGTYTTKDITFTEREGRANAVMPSTNKGVIFHDIVDRGGFGYSHLYDDKLHNAPSQVRVEFDPKNIRSKFARFDPRLAHLKDLSAGIPIGLLPFIDMEKLLEEKEVKDD
tara:strand:- start:22239 stop:23348 length:1110 start_codon:yes stop_codon:yes gene_type:complete